MKIAAGYIRVSTPQQVKGGEGLETQRQAIEDYANNRGWELVEVYADRGVSGAKKERPELMRLLQDAKQKKFDGLIVHRLSRLGRNARELLNNVHELDEGGVENHFIKERIDLSNPYQKAIMTVFAAFAEMEREIIEETMSETRVAMWRDGRVFLGDVPLGYKWNKETNELEVVDKEAKIYHHIVDMYLDEGLSFKDIAIRLRDEGLKGKKKGKYWANTIAYILRNPCYYGRMVVNRHKYDGKRRTGEMKPESEHITMKCPALISRSRWDRIQKRIKFNKRKGKRSSPDTEKCWLRDKLRCELCNATMKPRHGPVNEDGTRKSYYACYWSFASKKDLRQSGREKCPMPYMDAREIEEEAFNHLNYFLLCHGVEGEYGDTYLESLADSSRYDRSIEELQGQIEQLQKDLRAEERAQKRIFKLLKKREYDENLFSKQLHKTQDEILRLQSLVDDKEVRLQTVLGVKENDELLRSFLRDRAATIDKFEEDIRNLSPKDKKLLIESMVDGEIRVLKDSRKGERVQIFEVRPTTHILEHFVDEGKITALDKNDRNHSYR